MDISCRASAGTPPRGGLDAGVSIGLIQRYFTTKDQWPARPTQPEPTKDTAYRMLESMLPLLTSTVDGLILDMVTNQADMTHKVAKTCLRLAVDRAFGGLA